MEKPSTGTQMQSDSLQNKADSSNRAMSGRVYMKVSSPLDGSAQSGTSPRRTHNSRLDAMKRQFHLKKTTKSSLTGQQKSTASSSPSKSYLRSDQFASKTDLQDGTGSSSSTPTSNSHLPQTLTASNFGIKGSMPGQTAENIQSNSKSLTYASLRTTHGNRTDGAGKNVTNVRQGRTKTRNTQKSDSARQMLENVISKEMKASSASKYTQQQKNHGLNLSTSVSSKNQNVEAKNSDAAGSKSTTSASHFPATNGLPANPIASSNIREKLRQHHRQNIQAYSTKPDDLDYGLETGDSTVKMPSQEQHINDGSVSHNSTQQVESTNESILHRIRQKGPMMAKRLNQEGIDEVEGTKSHTGTSKQGSTLSKPPNKISSRPGSPRTPRRKASPGSAGRASPFSKRVPSPIGKGRGRNPSPNRRPPSPSTDGVSPYSPEVTSKKVSRVLKARLYLLQRNGPYSFRIGGDSPEHKYLVIIGPQTCNCGRGQFCIHILFVMLRVFQLEPNSGLLWRRTLKNYEVETLVKAYDERCHSRIAPKKKSRVQRLVSHLANGTDKADGASNSDDQSSSKGEEENCPICLLQMVDGESVTVCEVGCRNKLHTHCVNIWAEECKRSGGPLKCPLCRVVWKPASSGGHSAISELMVEIPLEYRELADSWIQVFGWELVSFLFSTHANVRENALRRLSHDITAALLTNNQTSASEEGNSDDSDSSREGVQASSSISANMCLASCCAILAMVCADPEYRVYITALRTFRGMMAYTQCRTDEDIEAFRRLLVPVIETILLKCADSNRRTVQLSVSTVMELCRGQSGELAVGKEIATGGVVNRSVGDVKYLLSFLEVGQSPDALSWQWMLGRLNALGELFREFRSELSVSPTSSTAIEESSSSRHLTSVAKFASFCLRHTSQPRVIKIARKVFLHAYTLATPSPGLINLLEDMMLELPLEIHQKLSRKTTAFKSATQNNPENSKKLIEERFRLIYSNSDDNLGGGDVLDIHSPQAPPPGPYYPLPNPSASVNGPPWFQQNLQHSLTNFDHEPLYPANSYRVPHASFVNLSNYAWTPRSRDKGVIEEPTGHHQHPPSPCTVTHPPTPPPSSVDTANLEAAIGVSLFRPIRCTSPGRDSSKPETQVPTTSTQDEDTFVDEFEYEQDMMCSIPVEADPKPPLRCFTVADAIAQGSFRPRPVSKLDSDQTQQTTDQHTSDRPTRPSLLRLKSESSAFQDLASPRSNRPQTATEPRGSFQSFIAGSRDRSSSHESTASSTSYTDEMQQASERRRTVRELADSINRKHAKKHPKKSNNQSNANPSRNPKITPPGKPQAYEMEIVPERPEPAPNDTNVDQDEPFGDQMVYDGITPNSKPLCLKGAIERRGTVERYREGLRYGTPPSALRNRKLNIQKSLAEESHLASDKKSDPLISPFHGQPQMHPTRTPARGILKNSGVQGSPVRVLSKRADGAHDHAFVGSDSGMGSEFAPDSLSTFSSVSKSSRYHCSSNQMTSPECENLPDDMANYATAMGRSDMTKSQIKSASSEISNQKSLRKQLSKSNSLPKDVLPIDIPESPTQFSDDEDASASSSFQRCPSAPAGSLLSDSCTEAQTLFPVKDDSLVEDSPSSSTSASTWRDHPKQTSPIRRRTPVRKLPTRPKTLAQRKKSRSKFKKQSSQVYSSVEDLDESDHSTLEKTPVTFKSEIGVQTPIRFDEFDAHTPTSSGYNHAETLLSYEDDLSLQCSCRMKIEEEEDKLFAHTLAVSYVQDGLPLVPHLSFTDEENDIVRCQNEHTDSQHEYKENLQWSKGAQIGLGAFSACYQARDIFTGTLMAVKQVNHVRCSPVEERQVLQVITEEIALMRRLSHPNIVRLHGVTREGPLYNIFVEWCAGGSVSTLLSLYGSFNEKVIVNYSLQMFRGLGYLHEQQLIHRDIKGANLLVDSTGQRLRISDFGAAARLASKGTGAGEFQGQLMGTIAFMAPEVLRGEQYGRSCDVWSAGCVITEMSSGKPPWEADKHSNHLALIFKIASAPSVPPIPESLSPALKDLCRRCLQADPRDRPLAEELLKHPVFIKW